MFDLFNIGWKSNQTLTFVTIERTTERTSRITFFFELFSESELNVIQISHKQ